MLFFAFQDAILGLCCGLVFIAVFGHALWLAGAWLLSAVFETSDVRGGCPRCGGAAPSSGQACRRCGWPRPGKPVRYRSVAYHDLETALERAWEQGVLPLEVYRRIRDELVGDPAASPESEKGFLQLVAPSASSPGDGASVPSTPPAEAASPMVVIQTTDPAVSAAATLMSIGAAGVLPPYPGPPVAEGIASAAQVETPPSGGPSLTLDPSAAERNASRPTAPDPLGEPDPVPAAEADAASANPVVEATSGSGEEELRKTSQWGAFLEEKNIRWGEVVGGLLVVGSSISLVVSFREQIHDQPWLQLALLDAFTACFFLLGLHVERSWKLATSGRGLLSIAVLLTPLNFLAIGKIGGSEGAWSLLRFAGEAGTVVLFAPLLYWAAGVLTPRMRIEFACGVLGASVCQWIFRRAASLDGAASQPLLEALALLPAVLGAVCFFAPARRERLRRLAFADAPVPIAPIPSPAADTAERAAASAEAGVETAEPPAETEGETAGAAAWSLLFLLGFLAFAVAVAEGFILPQLADPLGFARRAAPLLAVSSLPFLWSSMLLLQSAGDKHSSRLQVAGSLLAAAAALFPLAAIGLSWPAPGRLALTSLGIAFAAAATAWAFRAPLLHSAAAGALGAAYVVLAPVVRGTYPLSAFDDAPFHGRALSEGLVRTEMGLFLIPLAAVLGAAAGAFARSRKQVEAQVYGLAAVVAGAASWGSAMAQGFARYDDHGAVWVFWIFAAAALAAAWRLRRAEVAFAAGVLAFPACIQLVCYRLDSSWILQERWTESLLLHAFLMLGVGLVGGRGRVSLAAPLAAFVLLDLAWVWPRLVVQIFFYDPSRLLPLAGIATIAVLGLVHLMQAPRLIPLARAAVGTTWLLFVASFFEYAPGVPSLAERIWPGATVQTMPIVGCATALFSLAWTILWGWSDRRLPAESVWRPSNWGTSPRFEALVDLVATRMLGAAVLTVVASRSFWEITGAHLPYDGRGYLQHPGNPLLPVFAGPGMVLAFLLFISFAARALYVPGSFKILTPARVAPALGLVWLFVLLVIGWDQGMSGAAYRLWSGIFVLLTAAAIAFPERLPALLQRLLHSLEPDRPVRESATPAEGSEKIVEPTNEKDPFNIPAVSISKEHEPRPSLWADGSLGVIAVIGVVVPAALRSFTALSGVPVHGAFPAEPATFLFPLAAVAAGLAVLGVRRDEPLRLLIGAGIVGPAAALAYFMLTSVPPGMRIPPRVATGLQWCTFAWAVYSLLWLWLLRRNARAAGRPLQRQSLHVFLVWATCGGMLLALAPPLIALTTSGRPPMLTTGPMWWVTLVGTVAAVLTPQWVRGETLSSKRWIPLAWATLGLAALSLPVAEIGPERVRAVWLMGTAVLGAAIPWLCKRVWPQQRSEAILWTVGLTLLALFWTTEAVWKPGLTPFGAPLVSTPQDYHLWAGFPWLCACVAAVGLAVRESRRGLLWAAAFCLAASLLGFIHPFGAPMADGPYAALVFAVWLLPAPLWLYLEKRIAAVRPTNPAWAVHRLLGTFGLAALAVWLGSHVASHGLRPLDPEAPWTAWAVLGSTAVGIASGMWDRDSCNAGLRWYLWGWCLLVAGVMTLGPADRHSAQATITVFLASYTILSAYVWSRREGLASLGARLGMSKEGLLGVGGPPWFIPATLSAVALVLVDCAGQTMLQPTWPMRFLMGKSGLLQAVAVLLLASPSTSKREGEAPAEGADAGLQQGLRWGTLFVATLGAMLLGWACVDPTDPAPAVHRAVASIAVAAVCFFLAVVLTPRWIGPENVWRKAAVDQVPGFVLAVSVGLACLLGNETKAFADGAPLVLLPWAAVAAPAGLLGLAAAAIASALVRRKASPWGSGLERQAAVYAAIALSIATFVHFRTTAPSYFDPTWRPYWPLLLQSAALLAVVMAEAFRRPKWIFGRRKMVLALPLESFGAAVPAMAVAAAWNIPSRVDVSMVLFAAAGVYAVLGGLRRSWTWGTASLVAVQAGYWRLLYQTQGWGFFEHPQAWVAPLGLAVLAAAELHRKRLKPEEYQSLVYGGAAAVYVSSTADVFLQGVSQAPWLPLVLGAWSILGVLAGIQLRVRAFLFLGVGFLMLALGIMIRHAAVDLRMTWIWSAAGILTGVLLLVLFGLFEHRREALVKQFGKLREWDG